jgi:Mg2+ and Co2+ transporter CorA
MSRSPTSSQPDVSNMSEAGPSRIRYPPPAVLASTSRAANDEGTGMLASNSSSSLFWRGPLQPVANVRNTGDKDERKEDAQYIVPNIRRPSRVEGDVFEHTDAHSPPAVPASKKISFERTRSVSTIGPASIASSSGEAGGWVNWLSGRSRRAADRAEASKRLGKKLKRAEERARRKKQMAGRDRDPLDNGHDSDSDVVVAMEESIKRPPLDVPPPNETTADALSRVATKGGAKAPKLHFAPEEQKIRRKYLPQDYEMGELYRGLDEYVQASRDRRRRAKRSEKRRGSRASSRSSISKSSAGSGESSSSSSDGDDSKSSSSGSSSASGRLTMARLRAFFGDSSSSDSSSSSSSSSSTSSKTGASDTDSAHSIASRGTFALFRRRRASKASVDSDADSDTPATPRTPARHFQIKGGAERRRKRKAVQRYRAQEKRLIEEGKIPPKPSRRARKLARLAREQAGGITEYTLFTPVALSSTTGEKRRKHHHSSRPGLGSHAYTAQRVDLNEGKANRELSAERVLQTVSFASVKDRLHALRRYRRQIENAAGDVGVTEAEIRDGKDGEEEDREQRKSINEEDFDAEDGDLALPPPALDLPEETASNTSTRRMRRNRQVKDWHMSDVPLTPHVQMASDFARGFEVNSTIKADFKPTLNTQREDGPASHTGQTPPSDAPSSSRTNVGKVASGGTSTTAASPPTNAEAHAAWWLDISCPTYRDMAELSKMFPLHPLTVEDILQQDTREKVEVFEKLNYYFVVVRAIDEKYFKFTPASSTHPSDATIAERESKAVHDNEKDTGIEMTEIRKKAGKVQIVESPGQQEGLEGVSVGAINIYIIVFSHGVISFHFEDISNHTDRIRSRLLDLTQPVELTSDWIAHGMFDSIVDAFFPLLNFLETEIAEIETLTDEPFPQTRRDAAKMQKKKLIGMEQKTKAGSLPSWVTHEKQEREVLRIMPKVALSSTAVQMLPSMLVTRRSHLVKRAVVDVSIVAPRRSLAQRIFGLKRFRAKAIGFHSNSALDQKTMLRRITDTRKIVTGLSRLLAPKNDSVRGLRKRLVDLRAPSISTTEMSIYMGDVHDHIVTMLSHLSSNDYRLNDIHSTYLSTIRMANNLSSHSKDEILIILATVTVTIVFTVFTTSLFSFNVHVPMNTHFTDKHYWFGGVVFFAGIIPIVIIFVSHTLVKQAKKRTDARRAGR